MNLVQMADGSATLQNDIDGIEDIHAGGPASPTGTVPRRIVPHFLKMALQDVDTAAGMVSWQNTGAYPVIVVRTVLDVTTIATAACSVEVGSAATNIAATNLIASQDVHSATGTFGSTTLAKVAAGAYITASTLSGASAGLVGYLYVQIMPATL